MSRETASQETEADQLNALVTACAGDLAAARLGATFRLGGASFRLHVKSRNTIYRVRGKFNWFLKLSPIADAKVMPRERLGAEWCRRVLGGHPEYGGPFVTRVSLDPPYVLAAAIDGPPLTRVLLTGAWAPRSSQRLVGVFTALGQLSAGLHADNSLPLDAPHATKRPVEAFRTLARRMESSDETIRRIREWSESLQARLDDQTFIHGNLRLDNVLLAHGRIGFVDLEHCGRGPSYQDTSRAVAQLLLLKTSIAAPSERVDRILRAFLGAYESVRAYDRAILGEWVAMRLAKYYLDSDTRKWPGFIGGLPVIRSRLGGLTRSLMSDGIEAALDARR